MPRPDDIRRVVARAAEAFGHIDILVNNAGSARPGDFQKITDDDWRTDFELKFFGYMRMAREVMPRMAERRSGAIVNVIGTAGVRSTPGYVAGSVGNAGLMGLTRARGAGKESKAAPRGWRRARLRA